MSRVGKKPIAIPEKITVTINELELDQVITLSDLELPAGAEPLVEPDTVVVQCIEISEALEEEVEGAEAEPEVIGRRKEEEEGEAES